MIAYLISQNLDTYLYDFIRGRWKPLWLRNNGSTWISQLVDTIVFCTVALLGTMPLYAWLQVVFSTYILKIVIVVVLLLGVLLGLFGNDLIPDWLS